jgi:hypothetical protein
MMGAAEGFFYVGKVPIAEEVAEDILVGLGLSKRSGFYNRDYGAGLAEFENVPISLVTLVQMKLSVMNFFAKRNQVVTSGQMIEGLPSLDRRALTSQSVIDVVDEGNGQVSISIQYIMMADLTKSYSLKAPIGGV